MVHKRVGDQFFAYGPYVKEINLWLKYVGEVIVFAPQVLEQDPDPIDLPYHHSSIKIVPIPDFDTLSLTSRFRAMGIVPVIFFKLLIQMNRADHIHLRCPGNVGLIGCLAQIFFPKKAKSAKYAGNWDPESLQPLTYRWQRNILSNEFLTKNMKVLVYGDWGKKNRNQLSFFTASYSQKEIEETAVRVLEAPLKFIYVGSLHAGKNPMISCLATKYLVAKGINCQLHLYGEGSERSTLENFIIENRMHDHIILHGNVDSPTLKNAYQTSHFLLFASDSEGWPKAVAEAMFWGCVPVTTKVSCVPQMLDYGKRGELIEKDYVEMAQKIEFLSQNPSLYIQKATLAMQWSREFTLEKFESEIQKLLLK